MDFYLENVKKLHFDFSTVVTARLCSVGYTQEVWKAHHHSGKNLKDPRMFASIKWGL